MQTDTVLFFLGDGFRWSLLGDNVGEENDEIVSSMTWDIIWAITRPTGTGKARPRCWNSGGGNA
jgi:hypothetical protein